MKNPKKKSSGWRPLEKRGTWPEKRTRLFAAQTAEQRRNADRLRLWRDCPVRRCRRVRGCAGDPGRCLEQRQSKLPERRTADPRAGAPKSAAAATANEAPRFAMSAKEAAAAIAASIAETAEPEPLLDDELEAIIRGGRV